MLQANHHKQEKLLENSVSADKSLPKISIVTITYNRLTDLQATFNSVVNQTFREYEYIIVDGGSSDGTANFLKEKQDLLTRWVSEPDGGIYDAMNKGTQLASGEWIIFMNAGDSFFSNKTLQEIEPYLCSSFDVLLGGVESIYDDKYGYRTLKSFPHSLSQMWCQIPTCHQSILVRRELQAKYPLDTKLSWCADHDFLAKLHSLGYRFKEVPVVISKFEASGNPKRSLLTYTKERWEIYRRYFERSVFRDLYFLNEYKDFWIQQNVNHRLREYLPKEWVILLRKLRGI